MGAIPTTTMRIDPDLKRQANEVFDELGLTLTGAVTIFLKAVVREQGMPLELKLPAKEGDDPSPSLKTGKA